MPALQTSVRTIRRTVAVLAVLLAANAHILVRTTDPYQLGRFHHAIFAWTTLSVFWLGLGYLFVSVGYTLLVGTVPRVESVEDPSPTEP